jgi:hypothetical protein
MREKILNHTGTPMEEYVQCFLEPSTEHQRSLLKDEVGKGSPAVFRDDKEEEVEGFDVNNPTDVIKEGITECLSESLQIFSTYIL